MPRHQRNAPIRSWEAGDSVQGYALLTKKELRQDRNGKSYLDMELADASGSIVAKVWADSPALHGQFDLHRFIAFRGTVKSYREQLQLTIDDCREVTEDDRRLGFDEALLIPSTREDIDDLWMRLRALLDADVERPARRRRGARQPPPPPGRQVDASRLPRRPARARGVDGGAGGRRLRPLPRARPRPDAARRPLPRPRQAARAGRDAGQRLHARGAPRRPRGARPRPAARALRGDPRLPRRPAAAARAPGAVPPGQEGVQLAGRTDDAGGGGPALHRRPRRQAQPAAHRARELPGHALPPRAGALRLPAGAGGAAPDRR